MFTGIVADVGRVERARMEDGLLEVEIATALARDLEVGDSIAVNGVCLTATAPRRRRFRCQVMGETLDRSNLGSLRRGARVNLELAARLSDRIGGHLVQGHVDALGTVSAIEEDGGSRRVRFDAAADVLRYVVPKGSITIDGVSLTVSEVSHESFGVALIPHTLAATTLGALELDDKVNLEIDVIAKYVERLIVKE